MTKKLATLLIAFYAFLHTTCAFAAMTSPVADGYIDTGVRTTAEMAQVFEDYSSLLMELIGGRAEHAAVTLSSDAFAPVVDYCVYPLNPQSSTTDNLATISATSVRDGGVVVCRNYNSANTITIQNGVGNIYTADGADVALNNTGDYIAFIYRGSAWYELFRTSANQIKVLMGARSETSATIASGMLPLTQAVTKVIGEGSAADNLDGLSSTFTGNIAILRCDDASDAITVRNNQSVSAGYYKILTADGTNLTLDSLTKYVMLHKDVSGTAWREIFRGGFSSSSSYTISSVSGAFSMNGASLTLYKSDTSGGSSTGTLQATPSDGRIYKVYCTSTSNNLTVQTTGGELIYFPDGTTGTSFTLRAGDGVAELVAVSGGYLLTFSIPGALLLLRRQRRRPEQDLLLAA